MNMKKILFAVMAAAALAFAACNEGNDNPPVPPTDDLTNILFGDGTQIGNGNQEFEIKGKYVLPKGTYTLKGWVYVCEGSQLTIEAGSIIKGDKGTKAALIVERGGQIFAQGTASKPIVFTSAEPAGQRKPGDWGGIIICGRAKNNKTEMTIEGGPRSKHGGNDDNDNSGVLSYVRCEFAGYPLLPDQEINGITLGSVGRGTKIDHVQVSYSNDDSFEWFGGSVNCSHLVAFHGWDDDFDTDNGFSGKVQFCLSARNPRIADKSVSNSFESDNNADGTTTSPVTSCVFSNVTFIGPIGQDAAFTNTTGFITGGDWNPNNGSKLGQFQAAMHIRRSSNLSCFNSVAIGYPVGLIVENDKGSNTQGSATNGDLKLSHIFFAGMTQLASDANKQFGADLGTFSAAYFNKSELGNRSFNAIADLKLRQPNSTQNGFDPRPSTGSPLLGAASFSDAKVSSGFTSVNYIGAFSDKESWLTGWTEFDPQNAHY